MAQECKQKYIWTFIPISEFSQIKIQWDNINRCNQNTPLLDSMFIIPLIDLFSTGKELIGICKENDKIKAMGIFKKENIFQATTFQPNQAPVGLFVSDRSLKYEQSFSSLLNSFPGFILNLGILFQDSDFYKRYPQSPYINSSLAYLTPSILIEDNFTNFWNQKSKSFRKQFNNRYNKLLKNGIVTECRRITEPKNIKNAIAIFGLMESAGWKGRSKTAVHPDNIQGKFYDKMFTNFALKNEVRIYQYCYNKKIVAMDMCLIRNNILYIMKTTYDEEQKNTSPTQLMRREYLETFFANKDISTVESYGRVKNWHQNVAQRIRPMFINNIYRWAFLQKLHKVRLKDNLNTKESNLALELLCFDSITKLPAKIKNALSQNDKTSFFNGYNWYELLEKYALPENHSVKIFVLQDSFNMAPLMVYPILVKQNKTIIGMGTVLSNFSTLYGIEFTPIYLKDDLNGNTLLSCFFSKLKADTSWDMLNIGLLYDGPDSKAHMDGTSFQTHLSACKKNFSLVDKYYHSMNWVVQIKKGSFANYLEGRPRKLQNTLRRKKKKLDKNTSSEIVIYDDIENIEKAIEHYQEIYQSSWKEVEYSPDFINNFIRKTAQLKILRLGILYINGKPASFVKMLLCDRKAIIYKLAYSPVYNSFSPGSILLCEMIKHVTTKDNIEYIDFGIGDDPFKKDWMHIKSPVFGIIVFNKKSFFGLLNASKHYIGKLVKKIT